MLHSKTLIDVKKKKFESLTIQKTLFEYNDIRNNVRDRSRVVVEIKKRFDRSRVHDINVTHSACRHFHRFDRCVKKKTKPTIAARSFGYPFVCIMNAKHNVTYSAVLFNTFTSTAAWVNVRLINIR